MTAVINLAAERALRVGIGPAPSNRALCIKAILAMTDHRVAMTLPVLEGIVEAQEPKPPADVVPFAPR